VDCRGYVTPSLRGIALVNRYGKASLSRQKLKTPQRPMHLLNVMMSKTSNISYDWRSIRVRALGRIIQILIFDFKAGIIPSAYL
jgi:hypothetical protein